MSWRVHERQTTGGQEHAVGPYGHRCALRGALSTSLPCGPRWASPPGGSMARGPRSLETRAYPHRTGESVHTHTHRGNREHLTGLSVLLCGCAESPRRVSGLPLSVSLAPSGGLTPRVCSGPSQGGVPELGGQPAAGGPLGLPARRWGRRPGLPGGQDSGPVRPLLAESPSPVQKLPQGHALVL